MVLAIMIRIKHCHSSNGSADIDHRSGGSRFDKIRVKTTTQLHTEATWVLRDDPPRFPGWRWGRREGAWAVPTSKRKRKTLRSTSALSSTWSARTLTRLGSSLDCRTAVISMILFIGGSHLGVLM